MRFRDLIGHEALVRLLARAVDRGTLPPSLIFAGPKGVGKCTAALALAHVVNCETRLAAGGPETDGLATDACGGCATCRRIGRYIQARSRGREFALDCLVWLQPDEKQSIKIDAVRPVIQRTGFKPFDGRRRVVVIDDADALTVEAQQSLLKSLEEPPPATVFVLVTARPDALLATIRSRCPRLRFGPLSADTVARALVERFGSAPDDASAAAGVSGGSLGRALVRGSAEAAGTRAVATDFVDRVVQAGDDVSERLRAAQTLLSREGEARKGSLSRVQIGERLEALASLARDLGLVATSADPRWLANADLAEWTTTVATAMGSDRAYRAFSTVDRAGVALGRNVGFKNLADWLACHL